MVRGFKGNKICSQECAILILTVLIKCPRRCSGFPGIASQQLIILTFGWPPGAPSPAFWELVGVSYNCCFSGSWGKTTSGDNLDFLLPDGYTSLTLPTPVCLPNENTHYWRLGFCHDALMAEVYVLQGLYFQQWTSCLKKVPSPHKVGTNY